jgi:hypothetical protein
MDGDALAWPAQRDGAIHPQILKFGALLLLADVTRRGLVSTVRVLATAT